MTSLKYKFYEPLIIKKQEAYIQELFQDGTNFSSRTYLEKCRIFMEAKYHQKVLLTNTCTAALEIICLAENISHNDEVIMPSYTYVSTANAFVRHGATPVFVDICPNDLNIDSTLIEAAITPRTKALVVVHYAGVACNMDAIKAICLKHKILLIEDAAHAFGACYNDTLLGTLGDYGVISFDHTKNIHCGQGGMLLINDKSKVINAELAYENGTNKAAFMNKKVPYFEWVSYGSKYFLSDLNAAFLLAQLDAESEIFSKRLQLWQYYQSRLAELDLAQLTLATIPAYANHNGCLYHIRLKDMTTRDRLQHFLLEKGIETSFHFIPLHSSSFGQKVGRFHGKDSHTTDSSSRILRLPLHNNLEVTDLDYIINALKSFPFE